VIPAIQSGLAAVRSGSGRLDAAAADAARATLPLAEGATPPVHDLVGALVEMMLAKRQVEVGAAVIDRASQAEKSLLDILA
jgi:hypothetical protein